MRAMYWVALRMVIVWAALLGAGTVKAADAAMQVGMSGETGRAAV